MTIVCNLKKIGSEKGWLFFLGKLVVTIFCNLKKKNRIRCWLFWRKLVVSNLKISEKSRRCSTSLLLYDLESELRSKENKDILVPSIKNSTNDKILVESSKSQRKTRSSPSPPVGGWGRPQPRNSHRDGKYDQVHCLICLFVVLFLLWVW